MRSKIYSAYILLICITLTACSPKISDKLQTEIAAADSNSVIVKPDKTVFIFKVNPKATWNWYQKNSPVGQLEYGWWAVFKLDDQKYSCGYKLFKFPGQNPDQGSFQQLIKAGQVDLSLETIKSRKKIGKNRVRIVSSRKRNDNANLKTIIKTNTLIIVLNEKGIAKKINHIHPKNIDVFSKTPTQGFKKESLTITYPRK